MVLEQRGFVPGNIGLTHQIAEDFSQAALVLLLLSPHSLKSDALRGMMETLLAMHAHGLTHVLPILVGPFDWKNSPLRGLDILPSNAIPVSAWSNSQVAWDDIVAGIMRAVHLIGTKTPAPTQRTKQDLGSLAVSIASDPRANAEFGVAVQKADRACSTLAASWEAWLFDQCSRRDYASIKRLALIVSDPVLAGRLHDVAASLAAGLWPKSMEQALVYFERTRDGWKADVRFSFLGHICTVELTQPMRAKVGLGASLELEVREQFSVIRLLAKRDSPICGSRARIRDGVRALTKWLIPSSSDALGSSSEGESIVLEMNLHGEIAEAIGEERTI